MRQLFATPWLLSALMAAVGLFILISGVRNGGLFSFVAAAALLAFAIRFLSYTWVTSRPLDGVDEHLASGGVVVFWRPGCVYCLRLIRELDAEQRESPYWVNIWANSEAAKRLARYHDGNEVVPTVVTAEGHFVARDAETFEQAKTVINSVTN